MSRRQAQGFVSVDRLKQKERDASSALAEIRRIYFRTTRQTIEHDLAAAIELLMAMPSEDEREKATVFMHGLEEMRREWSKLKRPPATKKKP
jgi:hypothetical protein